MSTKDPDRNNGVGDEMFPTSSTEQELTPSKSFPVKPVPYEPDRSNDLEGVGKETSSTSSTEQELTPPERDHQQEDLGKKNYPFFKPVAAFQIHDFNENIQFPKIPFPANLRNSLISELLDTIDSLSKRTIDFNNFERPVWKSLSKGKIFNKPIVGVSACRPFQTFLKYYQEEEKNKNKKNKKTQYAFAVLVLRSGECLFSPGVGPDYSKATSEFNIHSEEILIGEIDRYLRSNGTKVQAIYIYTLNSPCLKRNGKENHILCCILKLLHKVYQWFNEYGIFTFVGFTKCWGPVTESFLNSLTYSKISSVRSKNLQYFSEFSQKTSFILDSKDFRKNVNADGASQLISNVEPQDRSKLYSDIKSAVDRLVEQGKSSLDLEEHMVRGDKLISSFKFPAVVQDEIFEILGNNWKEMVTNSFMSVIRKDIQTVNTSIVQAFVQKLQMSLGNSSPFHLYQIPLTNENMLN
ncbi:uncharacterized protein LOC127374880 [Dicentrarchus labrax]|uniref:uncharacterized protein LOC127374880 n=1 Tax=Dicentrarchus labrax TaxID=13489 RepID=UPI0021F571C9|nr:uncharacterized protein LOC127374880 [Dicentrarchus labrax]